MKGKRVPNLPVSVSPFSPFVIEDGIYWCGRQAEGELKNFVCLSLCSPFGIKITMFWTKRVFYVWLLVGLPDKYWLLQMVSGGYVKRRKADQ